VRRRGIPLYMQVERALRNRISSHELQPGDSVGSENELCQQFHVSKIVVRQALQNLENEGLIVKIQGKGSYVGQYANVQTLRFFSPWFDDLLRENIDYAQTLLERDIVVPPPHVARAFGLSADDKVFRVKVLRTLEGEPLLYLTGYMPRAIGLAIQDHVGPKVTYIGLIEQHLGIQIVELQQEITARSADAEVAAVLKLAPGAPVLWMGRTYFSSQGAIVVGENYASPDRYRYSVRITR
jgi:DNA-binding GntR family transcriptional regulator